MGFCKRLKACQYKEYSGKYVQYKKLYKMLHPDLNEEATSKFIEGFEENLDTIRNFIAEKIGEFTDLETSNVMGGDAKKLHDELHAFTKYIRLNIIGLKKLLKRHDHFSSHKLFREYKDQFKGFIQETKKADRLALEIGSEDSPSKMVETVSKYWIDEKDVMLLKMGLSRHIHPDNVQKTHSTHESPGLLNQDCVVTAIYFDNTNFSSYSNCLKDQDSSETIRIKWQGAKKPSIVAVERVTGIVDSRQTEGFAIKEKDLLDFLNGKDVFEKIVQNIHDYGSTSSYNELGLSEKSEEYCHRLRKTYDEIQQTVKCHKMRPMVRTVYKRMSYTSGSIHVTLDSNIVMLRECSDFELLANQHPLHQWCRHDVPGEWPFRGIESEDIIRFPYAVLKVSCVGDNPSWLSGLLGEVATDQIDAFSKSFHGCCALYSISDIQPYWMLKVGSQASPEAVAIERSPFPETDKAVVIPVRVEPKVFFANERTFLSWVQFAIFLGGVGTAMLGLGDRLASVCGFMLIAVACRDG